MIIAKPTRYGAGITLYGDYWDLKTLYGVVHSLSSNEPLERSDLSEFVLNFAYDIRHAYQMQRQEKWFGFDELDKVKYRGVNILWPIIIPQVRLLRWAASFHPTSELEQANLFLLEHCVHQALLDYGPDIAHQIFKIRTLHGGVSTDYHTRFFGVVAREYVTEGKAGKARFRRLPEMLLKLFKLSPEYQEYVKQPSAYPDIYDDCPDIKW